MKRISLLLLALCIACAPVATPTPQTIVQMATVEVTRKITVPAPVTVQVTVPVTVEVTRIKIVTPTATATPRDTPTPRYTPSITPTPSKTPTITPTRNAAKTATARAFAKLTATRGDGFYLVNVDIAPGIWRTQAGYDKCYWSVTRRNGDIIDNHYGQSGGTIYISTSAYQLELKTCGRAEYISAP